MEWTQDLYLLLLLPARCSSRTRRCWCMTRRVRMATSPSAWPSSCWARSCCTAGERPSAEAREGARAGGAPSPLLAVATACSFSAHRSDSVSPWSTLGSSFLKRGGSANEGVFGCDAPQQLHDNESLHQRPGQTPGIFECDTMHGVSNANAVAKQKKKRNIMPGASYYVITNSVFKIRVCVT